jgi:2,5-furandicarboxylate decarboxylase 1
MQAGIREFIEDLKKAGELVTVDKPVDPRDISAVITGTAKAVLLNNVQEYENFRVAAGIVRDRVKQAIGFKLSPEGVKDHVQKALHRRIPVTFVKDAPLKEVIIREKDVDLTYLPWVLQHLKDGGPYIGSGVQFVNHETYGNDAGMYRHMFLTEKTMAVDFNTPNDIRTFYADAQAQGKGLEMAVVIGLHPIELMAGAVGLRTGDQEMELAGALRGEPVEMIRCETINVDVPANAEIVLETEVLPGGWVTDEGRYGEFHGVSGDVKRNPIVKVKAITHRKNPIYHSLVMPQETTGCSGPFGQIKAMDFLREAGFRPKDVLTVPGSVGFEMRVSLDHPKPGEGKAVLLALLSRFMVKKVTVFDDDIDIFNNEQVAWAEALRVQASQDVVTVTNCPAKHMDPTVRHIELPSGRLPVTDKLGIDATIPPDIPRLAYERAQYFNPRGIKIEDYL